MVLLEFFWLSLPSTNLSTISKSTLWIELKGKGIQYISKWYISRKFLTCLFLISDCWDFLRYFSWQVVHAVHSYVCTKKVLLKKFFFFNNCNFHCIYYNKTKSSILYHTEIISKFRHWIFNFWIKMVVFFCNYWPQLITWQIPK